MPEENDRPVGNRNPVPMPQEELGNRRWDERLPVIRVDIPIRLLADGESQEMCIGVSPEPHYFWSDPNGPTGSRTELKSYIWGYGFDSKSIVYPGPVLASTEGARISIVWRNTLANPADNRDRIRYPYVVPPADMAPPNLMAGRYKRGHVSVHMHGAHLPPESDGYPMRLRPGMNPTGTATVLRPGDVATYKYPNSQPGGATLWYHDHAMDMTARNVYAGLAGGYLLFHKNELDEALTPALPRSQYEVPLVIQDRSFTSSGELLFGDTVYLEKRIAEKNNPDRGRKNKSSPEFRGHAFCVNGKLWPNRAIVKSGVWDCLMA